MSGEFKLEKKGNVVYWLFGFIFVWLSIFILHALIELVVNGPESNVGLFLFIGGVYLPVKVYFLFLAFLGAVCFGCFGYYFSREFKRADFEWFSVDLKERLMDSEKRIKDHVEKKFAQISVNEFALTGDIENFGKEVKANAEKMEKVLEDWRKRQEILNRQSSDLKYLKKLIENIGVRLAPKPFLTFSSNVEKIVGVGKKTAKVFNLTGIECVRELISEDPKVLAGKTGLSEGFVGKIQNVARMLVVPGISLKVVKCLQKVGICSLEELAVQSPMELYRRVVMVGGKGGPALEELAFSVRAAQYFVSKNFNAIVPAFLAYVEN